MMNPSKFPDIALVLISFVHAAPETAVILLPLCLVALVFSIVGVALFGGSLSYCAAAEDPLRHVAGFETQQQCLSGLNQTGLTWVSPSFNFDNSLNGMGKSMLDSVAQLFTNCQTASLD